MSAVVVTESQYATSEPTIASPERVESDNSRSLYRVRPFEGFTYAVRAAVADSATIARVRLVVLRALAAEQLRWFSSQTTATPRAEEDEQALHALYELQLRGMPPDDA